MTEELLTYLEQQQGPLAYLLLALAGAIEYVVPPFPGDTITLFGVFLAAHAGYSVAWVYVSVTAGSVSGGMLTYAFGRWIEGREDRWPRFLRHPRVMHTIEVVQEKFQQHGAAYLAVNRFVPALRAVVFVGAGLAGMSPGRVAFFGTVSAAAWNGLILAVGYAIGRNWETLLEASRWYTIVTAVGVVAVATLVWWVRRRRRIKSGDQSS